MKLLRALAITMLLCVSLASQAQQAAVTNTNGLVPPLFNFSGVLTDGNGKPLTGIVGVMFYLYQEQHGGVPLWMETQNVEPDASGHYSVMLGSTTGQGLPTDVFASGEARWLGVQAQGQAEQPPIMLLSVPYAMKAGDATTLGGKPASAYALAGTPVVVGTAAAATGSATDATTPEASPTGVQPFATCAGVTSDGTAEVNALARFTSPCNIEGSAISESALTVWSVIARLR
jgi:hypothetical protein